MIMSAVELDADWFSVLQFWINPLKTRDIIPEERRANFVQDVFWNVLDVLTVNTRLRDALSRRQKQYAVVEQVRVLYYNITMVRMLTLYL